MSENNNSQKMNQEVIDASQMMSDFLKQNKDLCISDLLGIVFGPNAIRSMDCVNFLITFCDETGMELCRADVKNGTPYLSKSKNFTFKSNSPSQQQAAVLCLEKLAECFKVIISQPPPQANLEKMKEYLNWLINVLCEIALTPLGGLVECQDGGSIDARLWLMAVWFPLKMRSHNLLCSWK
jgi:hypothetical protein